MTDELVFLFSSFNAKSRESKQTHKTQAEVDLRTGAEVVKRLLASALTNKEYALSINDPSPLPPSSRSLSLSLSLRRHVTSKGVVTSPLTPRHNFVCDGPAAFVTPLLPLLS